MQTVRNLLFDISGNVIILFVFLLFVFIGFGALAIDVGHLYVVRGELQNASDAAALAAVNSLYRPGTTPDSQYDWVNAKTAGIKAIKANYADGNQLVGADVATGYWNSRTNLFKALPYAPGANDLPAVQVITTKKAGSNDGPVKLVFAPAINLTSPSLSATAVAVMTSPTTIKKGGMLPIVVSSCMLNSSWNFSTNPPTPKLDGKGNPITWSFGPGMSGNSACGDQSLYTVFDDKSKANPSGVARLLSTGNLNSMSIGDMSYVLDQADNVSKEILPIINACSAAGDGSCEYITVPVVRTTDGTPGNQAIVAFACLRIISTKWGGNYVINAQLSTLCRNNATAGIGSPSTIYRTSLVH